MTEVNGRTKIAALLGYPVEHTKSPRMQNAAFAATGIDACYVAFSVPPEDLPGAVQGIRSLGLLGFNVTVPHKETVIPLLDEIDPEASFIGAVNTVLNRDGRLCGFNTDGRGFMHSLVDAGIVVAGKRVLLIGSGGAARAVGYYIAQEAASLVIANRTKTKADLLAADLNRLHPVGSVVDYAELDSTELFDSIDVIINTTSLGLKDGDALPVTTSLLGPRHVVCDLIYYETPLLRAASAVGAQVLNGSGMLLWQGALAFELWTGTAAPINVMREALG
jgi:shikimate dehydrogenase